MANLYSVSDSDGVRHIVAADSETRATRAVEQYLDLADTGADAENAAADYLAQTDLVPAGSVLSGVPDATLREEKTAAKASGTKASATK